MELYGQGRIIEASSGCRRNLNIQGLAALDLRTHKPDGSPWDFNLASDRQLALQLLDELKPVWVIGSPPCTAFSKLNLNLNFPKMPPEKVKEKVAEGVRHLHFVISIYKKQLDAGRHFLHEHPQGASSWTDPWMLKLLRLPGVHTAVADQCMYGLVTHTASGNWVAAKKPTKFATSSVQMASRLGTRCDKQHVHEPLLGGRAAAAALYPLPLITEILRGMRDTADFETFKQQDAPLSRYEQSMSL